VTALDAAIAAAEPREPVPGFARVIAGRPSWDERIDRWAQLGRQAWPSRQAEPGRQAKFGRRVKPGRR
jgi:hypothetical protein